MVELIDEDDALLAELGIEIAPQKAVDLTPREERVIAGFEEIQRFVEEHGRTPQADEGCDIFERLYAVRLERIRVLEECHALIEPLDHQGLLGKGLAAIDPAIDELDDDALLAELGIDAQASDITTLTHVRTIAEKRAAEEIANRAQCADFETFKPLFQVVQGELASGARKTRPFVKDAGFLKAEITQGQFFILGGQTAYIADVGAPIKAPNGEADARLRVIYSNGTESNLLLRSLQRALYKDAGGRRITEPGAGPLFAATTADDDQASGTIYVLRSKSTHPMVVENREIVHKIGVTNQSVESRIAGAPLHATFLMAGVDIVATYDLYNINRTKLEKLIHRVFASACLEIEIKDRFGNPVVPNEWFLVPLFVINEAVERIRDGTISDYIYDAAEAQLKRLC